MQSERQLRLLVQATGLYFAAHSIFSVLTAVTRFTMYRMFAATNVSSGASIEMRPILFHSLLYAVLLLIPAWLLLAKADWFTHAISEMSKPRDTFEDEGSSADLINS